VIALRSLIIEALKLLLSSAEASPRFLWILFPSLSY